MTPSDTSPAMMEVYYRRLADMTPSERIDVGVVLWEAANSLQRAAMRQLYPDADEEEITFRVAITRFGEAVARKAYRR